MVIRPRWDPVAVIVMLVDRATIEVRGGNGGDGVVSFRRAKYVPKGGPDGGDGGAGGSVYLVAAAGVDTLADLSARHHWHATCGRPGASKQRHGTNGGDLDVPVAPGTLVYDHQTGQLIADLDGPGKRVLVAAGGKGGFGNEHFKRATDQAPRRCTSGKPGQNRVLDLQLKLIADVGLIGMPNAGKSTLLSRISQARPKIGDYPFTTIEPNLGIATLSDFRRMVVADIPGLIAGASDGLGLGTRFLQHIERTRLLVHVLEADPSGDDPAARYDVVRRELAGYAPALARKPQLVVVSKMDLVALADHEKFVDRVTRAIGCPVIPISGATGLGLNQLLEACWQSLVRIKDDQGGVDRAWLGIESEAEEYSGSGPGQVRPVVSS